MTEKANGVHKIVLQAADGPRAFLGYVIVDLSLDAATVVDPPALSKWRPRYRWTDMTLYRVTGAVDGLTAAEYAVHVVGRTVLYHRADGPCRKGVIRTVLDLEDDARFDLLRPCQEPGCYPTTGLWHHLEDLDGNTRIAMEQDRPSIFKCESATDVLDSLRDGAGVLSELALKLLSEAASKDDGIAYVLATERPL